MWKSWLFPCACNPAFEARCWVPMRPLQRSCAKLKLHTGLAARAAYKKAAPTTPCICRELLSFRQVWINVWSVRLSLTPLQQPGRAEAAWYRGAAKSGGCVEGNHRDPTRTQHWDWQWDDQKLHVDTIDLHSDIHGRSAQVHMACCVLFLFLAWHLLFTGTNHHDAVCDGNDDWDWWKTQRSDMMTWGMN